MDLWRIAKVSKRYAVDDMSGTGAAITGGRWNSVKVPAVYTASSIPLAALETLVHFNVLDLPVKRILLKIQVPDEIWKARTILDTDQCQGWDHIPPTNSSTESGDFWLKGKTSLLLVVPSVIVPEETNVIINPQHPDISKLPVIQVREWKYDSRIKA